jgi:sugar diacid utilization regulator
VLGGGGIADIAAALVDLLGGWVVVLDTDGHRTAEAGDAPPRTGRTDSLVTAAAVRTSEATGRLAGESGTWAMSVTASGERMGTLVFGGRDSLDAGDQRTLERAALVTALVLLFRRQAAETEQRVRTDLLADLVAHTGGDGGPDAESLVARARLLGLDLMRSHVVAVCRPTSPGSRRSLAMSVSAAVQARHDDGVGLVAENSGDVLALVPGEDASAVAQWISRRMRTSSHDGPVTIGAAGPVQPLRGLQDSCSEARRTVSALVALGTPGRAASAADLGFAGLVVGGASDVASYVTRVLGPVLDYDARRRTDLVGTLEAYFAAGGSPSRAASALHVHTNTVAQRLDRVSSLIGADWAEPERALDVQLALRLHRLAAS